MVHSRDCGNYGTLLYLFKKDICRGMVPNSLMLYEEPVGLGKFWLSRVPGFRV